MKVAHETNACKNIAAARGRREDVVEYSLPSHLHVLGADSRGGARAFAHGVCLEGRLLRERAQKLLKQHLCALRYLWHPRRASALKLRVLSHGDAVCLHDLGRHGAGPGGRDLIGVRSDQARRAVSLLGLRARTARQPRVNHASTTRVSRRAV